MIAKGYKISNERRLEYLGVLSNFCAKRLSEKVTVGSLFPYRQIKTKRKQIVAK